jgi:hypothetical protein
MAETVEREALQATIQELLDALDSLCSAVQSRETPRIIRAYVIGRDAIAKAKGELNG